MNTANSEIGALPLIGGEIDDSSSIGAGAKRNLRQNEARGIVDKARGIDEPQPGGMGEVIWGDALKGGGEDRAGGRLPELDGEVLVVRQSCRGYEHAAAGHRDEVGRGSWWVGGRAKLSLAPAGEADVLAIAVKRDAGQHRDPGAIGRYGDAQSRYYPWTVNARLLFVLD